MKMAVHNGVFHADEVFGVALMETIEPELQVIRTRDEAVIAECDLVADVGGGKYDHHQADKVLREDGIPYCAFGLLWRDYGKQFTKIICPSLNEVESEEVAYKVSMDFITQIDASDNAFKYSKERSIVTSGGLGTMGFGLPAAIGATFGRPDRTVCVFMGDGGLQMNLQELGTVMEQKAPVNMILLNNNFLGNVRQWQAMFFNRRYSFTPMMNPDYMKIASAYEIPARRVFTREELAKAIGEMIATDGPFLLEACVEEEGNVMPMTPPGGSVNQMLLEC